jgi:hypothetical protein
MSMPVLLVVLLSAAGLAACGSTEGSPSATGGGSAGAAVSQGPAATGSPAVASPGPATLPPGTTAPGTATLPPDATPPTVLPSDNGTGFPACALLTPDQVSKILGAGGIQARPMPNSGWAAGRCAWNAAGSGFSISVGTAASIAASGDPATPDAAAKLAQFKQQASTPRDVPGIGDGAVVAAGGIAAVKGGSYLQVANLGLTEDQLIEIAKLAIARL